MGGTERSDGTAASPIPLLRVDLAREGFARHREAGRPVILCGAELPAFTRWSLPWLAGALEGEGRIVSDLPLRGNPYDWTGRAEGERATLGAFVPLLCAPARTRPCYFITSDLSAALLADVPFAAIDREAACPHDVTLWAGSRDTRSGLHFDYADNLLAQIAGTKRVLLAPPRDARLLYPRPSNHCSSRVDSDDPDTMRFPRYAHATFHEGELRAGEVLYVPPGWWHAIRAIEPSISVNCFFGPQLPLRYHLRVIGLGGPRGVARVVRDAVWHGVLRRPYRRELYTPVHTGDWLVLMLRRKLRGETPAPAW